MARDWASKKAEVARCIFCGVAGQAWWDCHCEWGDKIRSGKLPRPRTVTRGGIPVIECCLELRAAAKAAGVILVSDLPSGQVMGDGGGSLVVIEVKTEPPAPETEPPKLIHPGQTEPPLSKTEPPGVRAQKRGRVLAQILLGEKSDRAISEEVGVSRNTVRAIRSTIKEGSDGEG